MNVLKSLYYTVIFSVSQVAIIHYITLLKIILHFSLAMFVMYLR